MRGRRLWQNTRARTHTHTPPPPRTHSKAHARAQVSHIGKQLCNVAVALTHRARCRDREGRGGLVVGRLVVVLGGSERLRP